MSRRSAAIKVFGSAFSVHIIPVLKDNFSYVIADHNSDTLAAVDVAEVAPVLSTLSGLPQFQDAVKRNPSGPFEVLSTHKHWDHTGGNKDLVAKYPSLTIYGGSEEPITHKTKSVGDGAQFALGTLVVDVLHVPCHTSGHVAYHVYHPDQREAGAVFTGDTLFVGGIGAFFEGDSERMIAALRKLHRLPSSTCVFPGHEYTVNFLKFAAQTLPRDAFIASQLDRYVALRHQGEPTVPSTLEEESKQNVFMRAAVDSTFPSQFAATAEGRPMSTVELMQHLYDTCP